MVVKSPLVLHALTRKLTPDTQIFSTNSYVIFLANLTLFEHQPEAQTEPPTTQRNALQNNPYTQPRVATVSSTIHLLFFNRYVKYTAHTTKKLVKRYAVLTSFYLMM